MAPAGRLIVLAFLASTAARATTDELSLEVNGTARSYRVHVPAPLDRGKPAPLVLVFHGGGGNAANAARMSGMDAKADREGFIVAYPNGTGSRAGMLLTWNAWRCCGPALDNRVDDIGFVRAVVDRIARDHAIDRKRIYATGLSNGAMLTYRLGCEAADLFAAIAPVAGALNTDDCRPSAPVSVVAFHGTADGHVLFEGGVPRTAFDRHKRVDNSVAFAMDFWVRRDGCDPIAERSKRGHVIHDAYPCRGGAGVELYAIEGQGHAWPGGEKGIRNGNVDPPTTEISATDLMWEFFVRHPKP
jgi:polyhydroxybutyrate depolymerase